MQITWLPGETIERAREALSSARPAWEDHFTPEFVAPPPPEGVDLASWPAEWPLIAEHVARAERVSQVVREHGLDAARARFAAAPLTIEAATLAAAAHFGEELALDEIQQVLAMPIDPLVFYAPFLELLVSLGAGEPDVILPVYEDFAERYTAAMAARNDGAARTGAVRDGLADVYVSLGRLEQAEQIYAARHREDDRDVAVALSASRAFLQAGAVGHAVRWLGLGADRARALGRADMAAKLDQKVETIRRRLS